MYSVRKVLKKENVSLFYASLRHKSSNGVDSNTLNIRKTTESDRQEILGFLKKCFFLDNPLLRYLELITRTKSCEEYENYIMKCMENPSWNLVAIIDGKMVAVCLNKEINRDKYLKFLPKLPESGNKNIEMYNKFWIDVEKNANIFEKFPDVNKTFYLQAGATDTQFRRRGIINKVLLSSIDLAKELGYELIIVDCVSFYSAQIFNKMGFTQIYSFKYEDFKIDGRSMIKPTFPHERLEIFAFKIND